MDPLFMLDEEESAQVLQQEPPATREPSSEGADDGALAANHAHPATMLPLACRSVAVVSRSV